MNLDTKQNKIWVDKDSKWHNKSLKSWLEINNIEMYSTRSSGISVVAESFIRTLKNKHCKYMTSVSQNVYIDKLGNIVKKYSSKFHRSIKMNPVDVKSQINFSKENNYKDQKFKVTDHVRL